MGEIQNGPFRLSFNSSLKIDFQGSRVTSDGGFIVVRDLDGRLEFGDFIENNLTASRCGKNTHSPLANLSRQSFHSRMAGHADVDNAERFPEIRLSVRSVRRRSGGVGRR